MSDVPQQPPPYPGQQPPQWGAPPPQPGPPPGWAQGQPAYGAPAAPAAPNMLQTTAPRVLAALAIVLALVVHLLGVLVSLITIDTDDFLSRVAFSFDAVDIRLVGLLALALLLVRGTDDDAPPATGMGRMVVLGATVLGAVFTVFCLIGTLADLGADFFDNDSKASTFFFDVARLLLAAAVTWWAYRELAKAGGVPAGMPGGPPSAPPQQWSPPPANDVGATTQMPPQAPPQQQWQQPGPPPAPPLT